MLTTRYSISVNFHFGIFPITHNNNFRVINFSYKSSDFTEILSKTCRSWDIRTFTVKLCVSFITKLFLISNSVFLTKWQPFKGYSLKHFMKDIRYIFDKIGILSFSFKATTLKFWVMGGWGWKSIARFDRSWSLIQTVHWRYTNIIPKIYFL